MKTQYQTQAWMKSIFLHTDVHEICLLRELQCTCVYIYFMHTYIVFVVFICILYIYVYVCIYRQHTHICVYVYLYILWIYIYELMYLCVYVSVCSASKLCPTLCNPMDGSPPDSSVHGISQARVPERAAIAPSRGPSRSKDRSPVSCFPALAGRLFTTEPPAKPACVDTHMCTLRVCFTCF